LPQRFHERYLRAKGSLGSREYCGSFNGYLRSEI
jgi:hypothetical protein